MQHMNQIKVFLIDKNALFRKGLRAILADYPEYIVIGDASDIGTAELILKDHPADLLIIDADFRTEEASENISRIAEKKLSKRVIVLTLTKSKQEFLKAIQSGINGYLLKDEEIDHLLESLKKIHAGRFIVSELMVDKLVEFVIEKNKFPKNLLLSTRELEVLLLLQNGYSNNQISKELFITENTIKTHIKHIYKKMSVSNREEAIVKGILWGILN
ncbi:MAG: response regulator transcription factor [Anaerolineaceae bacterium]|jgi:DNA-binding NarL/FixJ family response regulator|nr:response regulator transcription factor [Anaerolineaceae bacterium]